MMSTKNKLIVHTSTKAIINIEIAESILDKPLMEQLNKVLIELNDVQEMDGFLTEIDRSGKRLVFKRKGGDEG